MSVDDKNLDNKIGVVIPVYNTNPNFLNDAILSVIKQTYKNWHLVIVNDGSTDKSTLCCLDKYKGDRKITIINKTRQGAAYARRDGVKFLQKLYKIKWIAFVDSDDMILENNLET
jgi:glycosyltransferase involved in cell wall biosynthesis